MPRGPRAQRAALVHRAVASAFRSRTLARALLGCDLPRIEEGEHYVDVTTLGLVAELRQRVQPGMRVLDMGTGSFAALALWLWKRKGCAVTCIESDAAIARRARVSLALNGAPIDVLEGSFFEARPGTFDLVVFNPPYVPSSLGEQRGLPESHRSQWDGGVDGSEAFSGFLSAFGRQTGTLSALVGVNRAYLPATRVRSLLVRGGGVCSAVARSFRWLPVDVYSLERTKSPIASTSRPEE